MNGELRLSNRVQVLFQQYTFIIVIYTVLEVHLRILNQGVEQVIIEVEYG